jgi:glycosyltransferase involved in cell wall biosynthesis
MKKPVDPKISIITPTFNQGEFIEKTILSILNQEYSNLEYIIIDGGSTDGTIEVIRKYEKHLKFWVSEKDQGQSHAINKGLKHVTGDLINWINSDDWLESGVLRKLGEEFTPGIDFISGQSILHYPSGENIYKSTFIGEIPDIISHGHIMQPSTFFSKKVMDEFLPLDQSLHFMMDHYMWLSYVLKYGLSKVHSIDEVIAHVLMHEDAKSVSNLSYFNNDRERIMRGVYSSVEKDFIPAFHTQEEMLNFEKSSVNEIDWKEINFNYLNYHLFNRDAQGKRISLNKLAFKSLLTNFPMKFIAQLFLKMRKGI